MPYYLWKITSIEKIWTLVIFISWCLTDHMTIWTKFVDNNGDLLEYLLSVMWSFGHRSLSGCKNVRKLCFWWFWGMVAFSGANKITGFFLIFSLHFHTCEKPQQIHVICWAPKDIVSWNLKCYGFKFWKYFQQQYFQYWWPRKVFLWKMVFLWQKQHYIYLKMKKFWIGQYTKCPLLPDSYRQWLLSYSVC